MAQYMNLLSTYSGKNTQFLLVHELGAKKMHASIAYSCNQEKGKM